MIFSKAPQLAPQGAFIVAHNITFSRYDYFYLMQAIS